MIFSVLSLALLADAAVVPSERLFARQTGGQVASSLDAILNSLKPAKPTMPASTTKLTPEVFPKAIRERVLWGPLKLSPSAGKHTGKLDKGADSFNPILGGLCSNCILLKADYNMADKQGKRLAVSDGVYLHHAIIMDTSQTWPSTSVSAVCTAKDYWDAFTGLFTPAAKPAAASMSGGHSHMKRQFGGIPVTLVTKGSEDKASYYASPKSDLKTGLWLGKTQSVSGDLEVINYRNETREVYFSIDYEYLSFPDGKPKDYLDVNMNMVTTTGCGAMAFRPPTDRSITYTSNQWDINLNGYILNIHPHLHDGAVNLQILVNGKPSCKSDAIYSTSPDKVDGKNWEAITGYTNCYEPIKVQKGDKLIMTAEFDLTKHKLRPQTVDHGEADAMAVAFFQFARIL